ncbi:hypothetical protein ACFOEK_12585 [Litoribrevibacter euphylliae]|uniref:Periplasmic heavy metal sensor n=1 Tax=Litoribrevibacter euphylliae TaxID=1834034 RepID=A0ABV7HGM2_9GAMM
MNFRKLLPLVLIGFILPTSVIANQPGYGREGGRQNQEGPKGPLRPDQLESELNLTYDQRDQFHRVMRAQMEKIHAFVEKAQAESRDKLSSVLTAEQLEKYDQLLEENKSGRPSNKDPRRNRDSSSKGSSEQRQFRFAD